MKAFENKMYYNPLKSRGDVLKWTTDLLEPIKDVIYRSDTRFHMSNMSSGAYDDVSEMEGFARIIWALATIRELSPEDEWWQTIREGLCHGTDPSHPDYYGNIEDYDQRIVETAAIGYAFVLRPECIYEPLSLDEKEQLIQWLSGVNRVKAHNCNWKFFRVMVNLGFRSLGLHYDKEAMEAYLIDLESYYDKDGWYKDGQIDEAHSDYYVPFAMHYYGLFYATLMEEEDIERCDRFRHRASLFAEQFVYWFDDSGAALPYGRSLTYRFAQVAFWSMMAYSNTSCSLSTGQIKGLILRHLRFWSKQPMFDRQGLLTIGYAYPCQFMSEDYNAPGSVYWALKTMTILALDEASEFWQAEEEPMPKLAPLVIQESPHMILTRADDNGHVMAYNAGNQHTNGHTHVECKYEKFVYSTYFGFSVPRSHKGLGFGAFDSTLAVSIDGIYYRHKIKSDTIHIEDNEITMTWSPYEGVNIKTTLICGYPWHIRIHDVDTKMPLQLAEGGYAIGLEDDRGSKNLEYQTEQTKCHIATISDYVGIRNIQGFDTVETIKTASNTNLMNSKTIIPTLKATLGVGQHHLVSMIYGDKGVFDETVLPKVEPSEY